MRIDNYSEFEPCSKRLDSLRASYCNILLRTGHEKNLPRIDLTSLSFGFCGQTAHRLIIMSNFFDNKARAAAAASNTASVSKAAPQQESRNLQPWVEK